MVPEKDFHDLHFNSIQALRGIAAIFVVMEHIPFLVRGAFGVDIFFCISGFMIMFATHKNTEYFFRKRVARIVPFYYLMTLGTYFLVVLFPGMFEATSAKWSSLIKSLLFAPYYTGEVIQPLVKIGWTINYEVFFYLLFGIAFHISHKYRGLLCSIILIALVGLGTILPQSGAATKFYSDPVILEFVLGILSYYIARWFYQYCRTFKLSKVLGYVSIPVAIYLFVWMYQSRYAFDPRGFGRFENWGWRSLVLVLLFFVMGLYVYIPKTLVMLGNISFSIYLIHYYPIKFIDRKIYALTANDTTAHLYAFLAVVIIIALSYLTWYLIEQRFTKWLLQKITVR